MKIYFLNPPYLPNYVRCGRWQGASARSGGMDYPKWLAYSAALLEKNGYEVKLVDAPAFKWSEKEVYSDIQQFNPDLIIIETNFSSLENDILISNNIKNISKNVVITMVGPPTSIYSDKILSSEIDIVAKYEFDYTILEIANTMVKEHNIENIRGISYKKNNAIINNENRPYSSSDDLNQIPFVSATYKKYLNVHDYFLSQSLYPVIQIFSGRGCPNNCTFCMWPKTLMGKTYRSRSPENIVNEFEYITHELPEIKEIFIEDDSFTINQKLVQKVCEEIIKRKINIIWSCNSRATLNYSTLKLMKEAGCRLLIVGYESGSEEILKSIKKGITKDRMILFSKDAKRAGLLIHGDFIVGLPGETKDTVEATKKFIKILKPNYLQVAIATPLPGTEFYEYVKNNNYLLIDDMKDSIDDNGYQKCIISYPDFTKKDIELSVDTILRNYYFSLSYVPVALRNILRKNGIFELRSMLRSANTFFDYLKR